MNLKATDTGRPIEDLAELHAHLLAYQVADLLASILRKRLLRAKTHQDLLKELLSIGEKVKEVLELLNEDEGGVDERTLLDLSKIGEGKRWALKRRLAEMSITQKDISKALGCDQATVSRKLSGPAFFTDQELAKLQNLIESRQPRRSRM
jgi:CRP-like cAMP-binding protein